MQTILAAAFRLAFSGVIPAWLWLMAGLQSAFMALVIGTGDKLEGDRLFILGGVLLLLWVPFAIWVSWRLSRALGQAKMGAKGDAFDWFVWTLLFGLIPVICSTIVSFVVERFAGEAVSLWTSALVEQVFVVIALPLFVHAIRRAVNDEYIPFSDTTAKGQHVFSDLRIAYFAFSIIPALLIVGASELFALSDATALDIAAVFVSWIALMAISVGQTAIAAVGQRQIDLADGERLPSAPPLM